MTMSNKVLFVPQHMPALNEMILVSKSLPEGKSVFFIYFYLPDDKLAVIKENNSRVFYFGKERAVKKQGDIFSLIKCFIANTSLGVYLVDSVFLGVLTKNLCDKIEKKSAFLRGLIKDNDIDKVVISTDRSVGIELSLAFLAKEMPMKIIVLSFAYSADVESIEKLRKLKLYHSDQTKNWNTNKLDNGKYLSFFKKFEKNAIERLKVNIKTPWVLGSGFSDCMLVDSEKEKNRLINMGGAAEKYIVTGQISHDRLFEENKRALEIKERFLLQYEYSGSKILLVSLPQYYEHGLTGEVEHFSYISTMINLLSSFNCLLVLSLHPKMDVNNYRKFASVKNNVVITDERLDKIMPICDLFICTYSSTIAWAILCQKDVIIVDHIRLEYSDFFKEYSIPVVKDNNSLFIAVKRKLELESKVHYPSELVRELSPFDGYSGRRISSFLS